MGRAPVKSEASARKECGRLNLLHSHMLPGSLLIASRQETASGRSRFLVRASLFGLLCSGPLITSESFTAVRRDIHGAGGQGADSITAWLQRSDGSGTRRTLSGSEHWISHVIFRISVLCSVLPAM